MFWIEIRSNNCGKNSDALDYIHQEDPKIDDLEWYFGNKFDMIMGPQEYTLQQNVVKSPPIEWLEESLKEAERQIKRYQDRVKLLTKELDESEIESISRSNIQIRRRTMLTNEEQDIVVEAMRKYPAGVERTSWGKSKEFFNEGTPFYAALDAVEIKDLEDSILLEHG